jgi:hypothetical protein
VDSFAKTYAGLQDDYLLRLAKERDTLRTEAQQALDAEITRRGLLDRVRDDSSPEQSVPPPVASSRMSPWGKIGSTIVTLIVARFFFSPALGWLYGQGAFWAIVTIAITTAIGACIGSWYRARPTPNPTVAGFFAWLCLFAWLSPALGLFLAALTFRMSPIAARPGRAKWLAAIGFILSAVAAGLNLYLRANK